jgi:hypothetical protein
MFFDLEGRLRKTSVPISRPLLPVFEAVANSIHAIQQAGRDNGQITIVLARAPTLDKSIKGTIQNVVVRDNGIGFPEPNYKAFETADTMYKLAMGGKGVGRFTWLVAFAEARIESRFEGGIGWRAFQFTSQDGIRPSTDYNQNNLPNIGTTVTLLGYKSPWREKCPNTLELIAADMIEHFIALFVSSDLPTIIIIDGDDTIDLRTEFSKTYDVGEHRSQFYIGDDQFELTGLRLRRGQAGRSHRLLYLADQREVKTEGLSQYLQGLPTPLSDDSGKFYFVGFIQGEPLDRSVDVNRSAFLLPESDDGETSNLFRQLTWRELRAGALSEVRRELSKWLDEIEQDKRDRIEVFVAQQEPHYQVLLNDIEKVLDALPAKPTSADIDKALSRRLYERRESLNTESARLLSELDKADQADPEVYRERMDKTVREYHELGMADLARYVCHRRVILELLDKALKLQPGNGKYGREDAIHSLVYPMRKTSFDVNFHSHNLWLLDERLAYNWRLYSDLPLSAIDIANISSGKEPDLIIFDHPFVVGDDEIPLISATIVEFKRPGRTDYRKERATTQVYNYLDLLRSGNYKNASGRPVKLRTDTPVTIYIVADFTKELLQDIRDTAMRRMPDGDGYYLFNDEQRAYVELISYEKLYQKAWQRNRPFFYVLGLSTRSGTDKN